MTPAGSPESRHPRSPSSGKRRGRRHRSRRILLPPTLWITLLTVGVAIIGIGIFGAGTLRRGTVSPWFIGSGLILVLLWGCTGTRTEPIPDLETGDELREKAEQRRSAPPANDEASAARLRSVRRARSEEARTGPRWLRRVLLHGRAELPPRTPENDVG